ncbi:MAG: universal stress protein [Bacteroidales bacterium]|nr:universal stress protein [Bacteroidales bacterium]
MEEKIITIASYPYSRAQLLRGRLEAEGIECFLSNINLVQPDISTGVKVKIKEADAGRAYKILDEIKDEYGKAKQQTIDRLKNVRRILVPVDFSEPSLNACNFALGLAHKLKAEIKLFYAYFNPVVSSEPYLEGYSYQVNLNTVIGNLEKEAQLQMKSLKKQLKAYLDKEKFANVKISYVLEKGVPEDQILQFSTTYDPGVIVMGTRGRAKGAVNLMGSVTKKIIQKATVPVFAIPQQSVYLGLNYMNKVLYATDFDDSDFKTLRKLMTLIRPFNMKIYCIHIASDASNSFDKAKMESLKEHLHKEYVEYNLFCDLIEHDDAVQGLEDYIDEMDIDMIALTTHKRGIIEKLFNPSLAKRMLFHTNIPLLVFHS